jgi:hypothetical protein
VTVDLERGSQLHHEALEKVAACAVEAIAQVEEWLGSASTRQAAEESLYRLRRALQRAGYEIPNGCLEYRGAILRAMEHAGIGMDDEGVIRIRRYTDKPWQHASGIPLYEHLHRHPAREK